MFLLIEKKWRDKEQINGIIMKRLEEKYLETKGIERFQGPIYVQTQWPYLCVKVVPFARKAEREFARRGMVDHCDVFGKLYKKVDGYRIYAYPVAAMSYFNERSSKEYKEIAYEALSGVLEVYMNKQKPQMLAKYADWDGDPLNWTGMLYEEWLLLRGDMN